MVEMGSSGEAQSWMEGIGKRLRQGWIVIALATLLATVALLAHVPTGLVLASWILLFFAVLTLPGADSRPIELPTVALPATPAPPSPIELGSMFEAIDMPVILLGADGNILHINNAASKAFGDLARGQHLSARLRSPGILDMVRETMRTNLPNQIEHSERLPSERVYIARIAPIPAIEALPGRLYALSFRDVSDLRSLDRMRSDFVANASHELRTPLASLRGFIETLQGPAKGDAAAHERFLAIMLDQATRMSRLVDDLLSLSRLEVKSHIAPDKRLDLVPLVRHVCDTLAPLAEDLGVEMRLKIPDGAVEVTGDRDELVQVIENLVENACKYGQDGKIIDVYLRRDENERVEFGVIDRGPGIPAEHVPRLTERFYRVSVADSRSKKGTGLGLAIVKHILTRHRARLIVRSELGKGTEFTVRF
ncbi:phosphate regulon sensor histidine kinase PhoR [Rhizobium sp. Root149]|uniref:phosphate regulon sensor histidine kinase PhoR n=1 Tax=Rhizobium sp. Root149 TaxID=1736473 RepID=UPI000ACAF94E|nr:phosphate regulon sensor histidine kinase PhoR [Rhizobium sp. Root149]